jgi:hypothetical protein
MARTKLPHAKSQAIGVASSAQRVPHPFDYSEAEWDEIEAQVTAVRRTRLSAAERASLIEAAQEYMRQTEERKAGTYLSPNERAKSWAKVERLCSQLCEALEAAGRNRFGDDWHTSAAVDLGELSLWGRPQASLVGNCKPYTSPLSIGHIIELLTRLGHEAEDFAKAFAWSIPKIRSWTGRLDPQVIYFQCILLLWIDFGGKLKLSRNPLSGGIHGPLVRYFVAVTGPVMKDMAPSLQSLPDIVRRQALFQKWLDKMVAEHRSIFKSGGYQRGSTTQNQE